MMAKCSLIFLATILLFAGLEKTAEATGTHERKTHYKVLPHERIYRWRPGGPWQKPDGKIPISVAAYFDMNGIRGTVQFHQANKNAPVTIDVILEGLDQFDGEMWGWHIHDRPVNWALLEENPCSSANIGPHYDPLGVALNPNYTALCAANPAECEVGDFSGRHGRLRHNVSEYWFTDNHLNLYGAHSIIGRSLLIHRTHGFRYACANVEYDGHNSINTYRAVFPCNPKEYSPAFQGEIIMRRSTLREGVTLEARLFRVDNGPLNVPHVWSLWRTNEPPTKQTKTTGHLTGDDCIDCSKLDHVLGTKTHDYTFSNCGANSSAQQSACPAGNLTEKCQPLQTTVDNLIHVFCTDTQLGCVPYNYYGQYYVGIQDADGTLIACSKFRPVVPRSATATFRNGSKYINVQFYQYDPHDPTYLRVYAAGLWNIAGSFQIREKPVTGTGSNRCNELGAVYEPRFNFQSLPVTSRIIQTGDREHIGELRIKLGNLAGLHSFNEQLRNSWVPLFGEYSVVGRSLVLLDVNGLVLGCANITHGNPYFVAGAKSLAGYH